MIKIGSLSSCASRMKRRTFLYSRLRKPKRRLPSFAQRRSSELPTATLHNRAARYRLGDWLRERGAWLRPRVIPLAVAFVAMLGVLGSMHYMSSTPAPDQASAESSKAPPQVKLVDVSLRGAILAP